MKVLVVKPSSLGDVVHSLRVMKQLKDTYSGVKIDWVIKNELEGILHASGIVNRIYMYHRRGGLLRYLNLIMEIRKENYDYIVDLQGLLRSSMITFFSKSDIKMGRADGREFSRFFYRPVGEKNRKLKIHAIDRLTPFLKELGVDAFNKTLRLDFPESQLAKDTAKQVPLGKKILLFPESRRREKEWPFFNELSKELAGKEKFKVLIAGTKKTGNYHGCTDLRGELTIFELPRIIDSAHLVVTNDSAPLHIASAMMRKTLSIFGPTDQHRYGPYPEGIDGSKIITAENGKIEKITIDRVLREILA